LFPPLCFPIMAPAGACLDGVRPPQRQSPRLLLPLSLLCAAAGWLAVRPAGELVGGLAAVGATTVTDHASGAAFPEELDKGQRLVATGVRKKFGAVKVYAVGLYLDKGSSLWHDTSPTMRVRWCWWGDADAQAAALLKEAPGKATLRLVITSGLATQEKIAAALRDSVEPRLLALKVAKADADEVLQAFQAAFLKGPALKPKSVIVFRLAKTGVEVSIGETYRVEVKSPKLAHALLATYVDRTAVAPKFRDEIFVELQRKH